MKHKKHIGKKVKTYILQIQPWIGKQELKEITEVLQSKYITENSVTKKFETKIQELTGAKHAIATTSGTTALYCGLKALNIGYGDEVIVPNLTFIASSNAVIMAGGKPVLCEVEKNTLCLDVKEAEALITENTKAIMPVHLYGQSADMDAINELASKYNLKVIEDAAEAIGATFREKHLGLWGDVGAISFFANKTITCGEGGIILTNNDIIAQTCRRLKNHGRDRKGTFIHEHIGFNFAFTDMQAAIGIAQLKKFPKILKRKQEIFDAYAKEFTKIPQLKMISGDYRCIPVHWFTVCYAEKQPELVNFLSENGIQTRPFFYPLHLQPCYQNLFNYKKEYPISIEAYEKGIALPSSYKLTKKEQKYIINKIRQFYQT
ncbi:MAG: DegT/DnrJ/EryC1/StrS family aminotransferase [Symploca sp. SIO2E9]|nr:DegT/DnrJ/EryC1/StrS family aminotransferase [Symploca sp. SIO2E9]